MTDSNVHEFQPRVVKEAPQAPTSLEDDLSELVTKARRVESELEEARRDLEKTEADLSAMSMAYDDLEQSMGDALEPATELFQELHRDFGHAGPWEFCSDRLCRRTEEWTHHRRREILS